jgi:hypothetical protein
MPGRLAHRALGWVLCASAALCGRGPALAEEAAVERAWKRVADPAASPAAVGAALDETVLELEPYARRKGEVTVYAPKADEAEGLASQVDEALTRARLAIEAVGLSAPGFTHVRVVWVRSKSGGSATALSESKTAVFFREQTSGVAAVALAPVKPSDGPPTAPVLLAASDRAIAFLDESASVSAARAGPGSLSHAIARAFADRVSLPEKMPPWLTEGVVCWIEEAAFPDAAKVPLHACGGPSALRAALSAKTETVPSHARCLGRLVGALLAGGTDGPVRLARIAASRDRGAAAATDVLGRDAAAVLLDTVGKGAAPRCDAAGTVPCPLCTGGKVDVACEACSGLGGVACPSCDGNDGCGARGCSQGAEVVGLKLYDCRMCVGTGYGYCLTCKDAVRFACKVCGASGKVTRSCLVCRGGGRIACPEGGTTPGAGPVAGPADACAWCRPPAKTACAQCYGSGFEGCRRCFGFGIVECTWCDGSGCKKCLRGRAPCPQGTETKMACKRCKGAGAVAAEPARCLACAGSGRTVDAATARTRVHRRLLGIDAALRKANGEVSAKATRFLLKSAAADGTFVLRHHRDSAADEAGSLNKPSLFANAKVLTALLAARVPKDKPEVAAALDRLERTAALLIEDRDPTLSVQSVALTVRPLLLAGRGGDDPLVQGLVKRLVAAQRPNGHWGHEMGSKEPGEAFQSLFAVESLWLAQRRGAKVPSETWSRALAAGLKVSVMIPRSMRKGGFLTGTDVASNAALIVLAKAGGLGDKAKNLDEYRTIPQVVQALAWLDRHFEVRRDPVVAGGAMVRGDGDGGYSAWLYSVERLARLLAIDELGARRWYPEGCRHLASIQLPDGSFEELHRGRLNGPVRTTSSALLFLERATPPLTSDAVDDTAPPEEGAPAAKPPAGKPPQDDTPEDEAPPGGTK